MWSQQKSNTLINIIVNQSIKHLFHQNENITLQVIEDEGICLASYIFLKDNFEIDFELDYISKELLDPILGEDFEIVDQVFDILHIIFPEYTEKHAEYGKHSLRMNLKLTNNYGAILKSHFLRYHKIKEQNNYNTFDSPSNSLWSNGKQSITSPTRRIINYYFDKEGKYFELLIPPYNPLVTGRIVSISPVKIECRSNDGTRTFIFHLKNNEVEEVEMYRNDKNDLVKYHNY